MRPPFARDTIANRILLGNVVLTACAVAVTTLAATVLLRTYLYQRVDEQLGAVARAPGVLHGENRPPFPCGDRAPDDAVLPTDFSLTFLDVEGEVVCRLGTDEPPAPLPEADDLETLASAGDVITLGSDDAGEWRSTVVAAPSGAGETAYAVVSLSVDDVLATVRRLITVGLGVGFVVVLLAALTSRAMVHRGLRPLTRIRETTRAIAAGDLTARVPQDLRPAEAAELSAALNTMLAEVERGFAREQQASEQVRRFAADASHELRTPLTSIVGYAQLFRQLEAAPGSPEAAQIVDRIEAEAIRMSSIVSDLLLLARLDRDRELDLELVDLLEVVHDVVGDARVRHPDRELVLTVFTPALGSWQPPPVHVWGDGNALRQVAGNLVANAVAHTPASSTVEVQVGRTVQAAVMVVRDAGPGMDEDVRAKVFERFFRGDASRNRTTGGSGLGLSIVAALVEAHRGTVDCASTPEGGSTFTVTFPAADPRSTAGPVGAAGDRR